MTSIIPKLLTAAFALCWMACSGSSGADGESSGGLQNPPTPPQGVEQTVTTDTVRARSLAVCLNCHNGVTQSPDLRTAQAVKNNSSLIQFWVNNNQMPPANSGFPLLTACQKDILNRWVQLGLPDTSTVKVSSLPNCPNGLIELDEEFFEEN